MIAYGEAAPLIEQDLDGVVPLTRLGSSFDEVVAPRASSRAPGDVVLLSPACSSYDMFDNYEQRGAVFKQLAAARAGHENGCDGRTSERRARAAAAADVRERWRMGPEARASMLVSAVLTAFGLAVLYSASAFVAMQRASRSSAYFLVQSARRRRRRASSRSRSPPSSTPRSCGEWAWPIMWFTIAAMARRARAARTSIAPTIHGSRRFLFGGSFQPSEFGKLAVVVWVLDADREEGRQPAADSPRDWCRFSS